MRRAALALLVGSLLAVAAPTGWLLWSEPGPEPFGGPAQTMLSGPPGVGRPGEVGALDQVVTRSARLADVVAPSDPPVEVRLRGASAAVDPVGLDPDRQVVLPDDVGRVGWYEPGAQPGDDTGSAVLVGHVDDRQQGLGAFAVLRGVAAGDEVEVSTASGARLVYVVVSLEKFAKSEVPMQRLFAREGPHRLVLITCGGDFDTTSRTWSDNIVVTAVRRP